MDKIHPKIILVVIILIGGCANQLPPGGGEVDIIPPEVIEVYPVNGTTNYEDNYFELEFSEYVDKRSFKDALFISPHVEGRLEYEWTGTSVNVSFVEGLKKDITYTITVGTDVVDRNNKNRMANSYSFSFSTGSKIDRRTIAGHVYNKQPEGVLIFAYKLDEGTDTLLKRKSDYVSQTGKDGKFQLKGLSEANYRLFAIMDKYRDFIYDLNQDLIGIPNTDIILEGSDTSSAGVHFKLFEADTSAPRLLKSIMTDERHILASVTEEIDKKLITADNYHLIDSTTNHKIAITQVFKKHGKNDELVLVPAEIPDINNSVFLFADTLRDTLGNEYLIDFVSVTISDKHDTTAPGVITTDPPGRNSTIDFKNPKISFYFNDGFEKFNIQSSITFTDTLGKVIPFIISYEDDATFNIYPLKELIPEKDYIIKVNLNAFVDASGNKLDSVYKLQFKTISGLEFTGVTGKLLNVNYTDNPVLVLENIENDKLKYQTKVSGNNFNFDRIEAGKYSLWCYFDSDSNYKYNYGWPQPIMFSERFSVYTDTLKLKPRWVITDVIFNFK